MTQLIGPLTGLATGCGSMRPLRKPAHSRRDPDPAIHLLALLETFITPLALHVQNRRTRESIDCGLQHAARLGLDVRAMTERLQADALDAFASSFEQMLVTIAEKRGQVLKNAS